MACFAALTHREHFACVFELPLRMSDCSRNPQVIATIGHLRKLTRDNTGLRKSFIHIPQWAGTAGIGKMYSGCGLTLRHISNTIYSNEGKRHTAQVRTLKG